jgi:hypothetical protein
MSLFEYALKLYIKEGFDNKTAYDMAMKLIENLKKCEK